MSSRFHNKWHRVNHHTDPTPGYPDSHHDPIASPEHPFKGTFVVDSTGVAISSNGNIFIGGLDLGDITCENITVANTVSAADGFFNYLSSQVLIGDSCFLDTIIGDVTVTNGDVFISQSLTSNDFYSPSISANYFYGDGTNITGVIAEWDGSHTGDANITGNLTVNTSISSPSISADNIFTNQIAISSSYTLTNEICATGTATAYNQYLVIDIPGIGKKGIPLYNI